MAETIVKVGQIWRDNDPRVNRFVRIIRVVRPATVRIRSCYSTGENKRGRAEVSTGIERFVKQGTRGFTLVKDV
jgi:hypothetical protein